MNTKRVAAMLAVLVALAGCGLFRSSDGDSKPDNQAGAGTPTASQTRTSGNRDTGARATLKLTGYYTYDGPVDAGTFGCYHSPKKATFELEAQEPYLIDIRGTGIKDGTFPVLASDPRPTYPAGQPVMDVYRLDKADGVNEPSFLQMGGTITFTQDAGIGTLEVDYDTRGGGHKVHVVLKWTNCVQTTT